MIRTSIPISPFPNEIVLKRKITLQELNALKYIFIYINRMCNWHDPQVFGKEGEFGVKYCLAFAFKHENDKWYEYRNVDENGNDEGNIRIIEDSLDLNKLDWKSVDVWNGIHENDYLEYEMLNYINAYIAKICFPVDHVSAILKHTSKFEFEDFSLKQSHSVSKKLKTSDSNNTFEDEEGDRMYKVIKSSLREQTDAISRSRISMI